MDLDEELIIGRSACLVDDFDGVVLKDEIMYIYAIYFYS